MTTPRDMVLIATARAQGVLMTMGALIRDMGIANMVPDNKAAALDEVVGHTIHELNKAAQLWDCDLEAGDADE